MSSQKIAVIVVFAETQRSEHVEMEISKERVEVHQIVEKIQEEIGWPIAKYAYEPFLNRVAAHEYALITGNVNAIRIVSKAPTPPELIEDSHPLLAEMRRSGLA